MNRRRFGFGTAGSVIALAMLLAAPHALPAATQRRAGMPNTSADRSSPSGASLPEIAANDNRTPAGRLERGVLTLHLEIGEGEWHPGAQDGPPLSSLIPVKIDTYAFGTAGQSLETPGPLIRVPRGTELRISVHNSLKRTVWVHGLNRHPARDADNLLELAPGETKQTTFSAGEPGSYLYWASTGPLKVSFNARPGSDNPLSGAFIVDGPAASSGGRVFVIGWWAKDVLTQNLQVVFTINGKTWPYTERVHAIIGKAEYWRVLNSTPLAHPMHLHGFYFHVTGVGDGESEQRYKPAQERMENTELVSGGHTFDLTWTPDRMGNWLFHCHVFGHMTVEVPPELFGPSGPPPTMSRSTAAYGGHGMDMAGLVLGIEVTAPAGAAPVKAEASPVGARRHLFVRERPVSAYAPAGPGFYLQGVSKQVGPIGPPLVIHQGVRTAITITNQLKIATAVHWHGLEDESYYDGVPGWDGTPGHRTPVIPPGGSFVAYLTPPRAGTFIYHTHWGDETQLTGGLYGALLVLPRGEQYSPASDKVFVLGRSGPDEYRDPLVLNGSPQPGVMFLLPGKVYRFRFINITPGDIARVSLTSLAVPGRPARWRPIAKDGADLPRQQAITSDAEMILAVGETRDFEFAPKVPGRFVLTFLDDLFGSALSQVIFVVPPKSPLRVFAARSGEE
jgi:FtsP/CotA-like multicopper oxidase with cupredoxin domain